MAMHARDGSLTRATPRSPQIDVSIRLKTVEAPVLGTFPKWSKVSPGAAHLTRVTNNDAPGGIRYCPVLARLASSRETVGPRVRPHAVAGISPVLIVDDGIL